MAIMMATSNSIAYRGLPAILVIQGAFSLPMFFLMRFRTFFNNWFICSLVTIDTWVLSSKKKKIIILYWYLQCSLSFIPYTTYISKVPRMNTWQTNQEYLASSISTGVRRVIPVLLQKFWHVLTAPLLAAMVLNYATCNISMGGLFTPMGEQRVNIKFFVTLGKSATETYSKCMVITCYHAHVCLKGKRFHEALESTEDDGRSGCPSTVCIPEKIRASPDSSCNKIVKLPLKCLISWTSARWPTMKFCTRILARENWMQTHARATVLQFVSTFQKLQAKITHSVLPSSLVMKHGAYSKTHKQKQKVQSGEAQTRLPQRNPVSSLQKRGGMGRDCFLIAGVRNFFQRVKL